MTLAQDKWEAPTWNIGERWKYRADNGMEWINEIIAEERDVYISKYVIPQGDRKGEWVQHYKKGSMNVVKVLKDGQEEKEQRDRVKKAYDFPLHLGKKWDYSYSVFTATRKFDALTALKVVRVEEVEVLAGKFKAIKVELTQSISGSTLRSGTAYFWYSPEVKAFIKLEFVPSDFWRTNEYNKYELVSYEHK
jgi:hypothetical protein